MLEPWRRADFASSGGGTLWELTTKKKVMKLIRKNNYVLKNPTIVCSESIRDCMSFLF